MSIGVAFQAFFAALFNQSSAERIRAALADSGDPKLTQASAPTPAAEDKPAAKPVAPEPKRSDALTLLSTLQREARLLDLVQESLDSFEDAQIGAAAREVLNDTRKTLDRMFSIQPLCEKEEGESISVESGASPNRIRLVGKSEGQSGVIAHRGWQAARCEVPKWTGKSEEALLLAPTEIEVQ